jgi:quercetin dioxygenase-like cupin family protein
MSESVNLSKQVYNKNQYTKVIDTSFKELGVQTVQEQLNQQPNVRQGDDACPLKHSYADGCYIREIFMPKGSLLTSKIHKVKHPYFILKGKVTVVTDKGEELLEAPFSGITEPGTKRLLYIHEDTIWATVHVTEKTNLKEIEQEIIAKDFNEIIEEQTKKELLE